MERAGKTLCGEKGVAWGKAGSQTSFTHSISGTPIATNISLHSPRHQHHLERGFPGAVVTVRAKMDHLGCPQEAKSRLLFFSTCKQSRSAYPLRAVWTSKPPQSQGQWSLFGWMSSETGMQMVWSPAPRVDAASGFAWT